MATDRMAFTPRVELLRRVCRVRLPANAASEADSQLVALLALIKRRNDLLHSVIYPGSDGTLTALRRDAQGQYEEPIDFESLRSLAEGLDELSTPIAELLPAMRERNRERVRIAVMHLQPPDLVSMSNHYWWTQPACPVVLPDLSAGNPPGPARLSAKLGCV